MELKIGDVIYMVNNKEAIYRIDKHDFKHPAIDKSNYHNGVRIGTIIEINYINDEKCASVYSGDVWYRSTHITNEKIQ